MSTLVPTVCAACAEFAVSPAITEPHEHMVLQSERRQALNNDYIELYHCLECEASSMIKRTDDHAPATKRRIQRTRDAHYLVAGWPPLYQGRFLPEGAVSIS